MKVYLEEKDIGRKITTYHDGFGTQQGLYVYGKDKIEVLSLSDYTKQVIKEVCDRLTQIIDDNYWEQNSKGTELIEKPILPSDLYEILDQIQEQSNNSWEGVKLCHQEKKEN